MPRKGSLSIEMDGICGFDLAGSIERDLPDLHYGKCGGRRILHPEHYPRSFQYCLYVCTMNVGSLARGPRGH